MSSDRPDEFEPPPAKALNVFTKRTSNPEYDVIHFAVHLVVDVRDIPTIISGISKVNFYVPLSVSYSAVRHDMLFQGKVYGSEPVVNLSVNFDGYFFREIYAKFMPPGIKDRLGIQEGQATQ